MLEVVEQLKEMLFKHITHFFGCFFILVHVLLQRSYVDVGFLLMGLVKCLEVDVLQILKRFMKQ